MSVWYIFRTAITAAVGSEVSIEDLQSVLKATVKNKEGQTIEKASRRP